MFVFASALFLFSRNIKHITHGDTHAPVKKMPCVLICPELHSVTGTNVSLKHKRNVEFVFNAGKRVEAEFASSYRLELVCQEIVAQTDTAAKKPVEIIFGLFRIHDIGIHFQSHNVAATEALTIRIDKFHSKISAQGKVIEQVGFVCQSEEVSTDSANAMIIRLLRIEIQYCHQKNKKCQKYRVCHLYLRRS